MYKYNEKSNYNTFTTTINNLLAFRRGGGGYITQQNEVSTPKITNI